MPVDSRSPIFGRQLFPTPARIGVSSMRWRHVPEALGVVGVQSVRGDAGLAGVRGAGVDDGCLIAVLEVAAADALELR